MTWKSELAYALGARVASAEHVAGGDINDAFCAQLTDGRSVFVKTHRDPPAGMFAGLSSTGYRLMSVPTPVVVNQRRTDAQPSCDSVFRL